MEELSGVYTAPVEKNIVLSIPKIKICCFATVQRREPQY